MEIPCRHKDQETNPLLLFMDDLHFITSKTTCRYDHHITAITLRNTRWGRRGTLTRQDLQIGEAFYTSSHQQNLHVM